MKNSDQEPASLRRGDRITSSQTVAITQILEDRLERLEEQFKDLDAELRGRFGEASYSVERSEQLLGAIQRLRWAISAAPVASPLTALADRESA